MPMELLIFLLSVGIGAIGWLAKELSQLTNSINTLNENSAVMAKTVEIINDGMLENRKHIGELFECNDKVKQDISGIKTACNIHHGGGR